jgi:hypothetical protein
MDEVKQMNEYKIVVNRFDRKHKIRTPPKQCRTFFIKAKHTRSAMKKFENAMPCVASYSIELSREGVLDV